MSETPVLPVTWNGDAFEPANSYWRKEADRRYTVGERYVLTVEEIRSEQSHKHMFAAIREAWMSLPESYHERYATPDHLRRWALIKTGFREERSIVCASETEARRVAAFVRPVDDYAVVVVRDNIVVHLTAKSQSSRAMGKDEFQRSKTAVLDCIAQMLDVTRAELETNGEAA
jgi:hypothetical protein